MRTWIATQIMASISTIDHTWAPKNFASSAVKRADALIAELNKPQS